MKVISFLVLILLLPANAYATRWYDVEVIIFANSSDSAVQEEQWPIDPGTPDVSNSVSLVSQDADSESLPGQVNEFETIPFKILPGSLRKLQHSSQYRVIYARAWRLPDLPSYRSPPVRIRAGKRFTTDGDIAPFIPTVAGTPALMAAEDNSLYEIDGRIKVSVSKFLDVDADLLYRRHVTLPDAAGVPVNEFRQFRLTEFRRMKSNTIHYLDHPLFGVVIAIGKHVVQQEYDMPEPKSVQDINQ